MKTRTNLVQQRQNPLREQYRRTPEDAWIIDGAQTVDACAGDAFHGAVVPVNNAGTAVRFGIHRAVGGDHDLPNPGDLLSAALAACFDSTLRMLAEHLGIRLKSLTVEVEAQCDVRGCLLVERTVPIGFQNMRCRVQLQPKDPVEDERLQLLIAAAENSCVVMQTLRKGVRVEAALEAVHAVATDLAAQGNST